MELPVGLSKVSAGFPSPAEDFKDRELDINEFLIARPKSTAFFQVDGPSVQEFGIYDGDFVVVRQQPTANNGDIVAALLEDEATVKTFKRTDGQVWLMPHNPAYSPIDGNHASILGKVVAVLRRV